jgi:hypothetical protein
MRSSISLLVSSRCCFREIYKRQKNTKAPKYEFPEELSPLFHGRKGKERRDSITVDMLNDRKAHRERLDTDSKFDEHVIKAVVTQLEKAGFGVKKRRLENVSKRPVLPETVDRKSRPEIRHTHLHTPESTH